MIDKEVWRFTSFNYIIYHFIHCHTNQSGKRTIVASHDTANTRGKFEHVGHSGGVQQFVL